MWVGRGVFMKTRTYQNTIAVLFSLTWGLVLLDRNAISFLFPILMKEFNLNNAQTGQIVMYTGFGFVISSRLPHFSGRQIGPEKTVAGSCHHTVGNIFGEQQRSRPP